MFLAILAGGSLKSLEKVEGNTGQRGDSQSRALLIEPGCKSASRGVDDSIQESVTPQRRMLRNGKGFLKPEPRKSGKEVRESQDVPDHTHSEPDCRRIRRDWEKVF